MTRTRFSGERLSSTIEREIENARAQFYDPEAGGDVHSNNVLFIIAIIDLFFFVRLFIFFNSAFIYLFIYLFAIYNLRDFLFTNSTFKSIEFVHMGLLLKL